MTRLIIGVTAGILLSWATRRHGPALLWAIFSRGDT